MALYTRYVLTVDSSTGNDTQGSGSSATVKDSDSISGTTLVITNAAGGSSVTRADAAAFAGPPVALQDTIIFTDTVGGLGLFHIAAVSANSKTLTLVEAPSTGTSIGNPWGVGGTFLTIARAASVVTPTNTNAGADDHVYVRARSGYSGTAKITFSKAGSRSRCLVVEGYTTSVGDGGRTTYDITATAVVAFEPNANDQTFRNFTLTDTGNVAGMKLVSMAAGRGTVDNVWCLPTGAGATTVVGVQMVSAGWHTFRLRVSSSTGLGTNVTQASRHLFGVTHDGNNAGWNGNARPAVFCISDTNCTGTVNGGFADTTSGGQAHLLFCTSYNQSGGDGARTVDNSASIGWAIVGSIFSNNNIGVDRQGITVALPFFQECFNDFFASGTSDRVNCEDTTSYDTTPTDSTANPNFSNAAGQNFAAGAPPVTIAFQVGGTTYLEMGALQRQAIAPLAAQLVM